MNKIRIAALAGAVALALGALEGCTLTHQSDNAATKEPTGPAAVVEFPFGYRNVAHKCDGPNMVYSVSAGSADTLSGGVAVVPNDPRCKS